MPAYIICLGVALALFGSSQPTGADRIPPVLARAVQPLQPPPAAGSWVLQVISRGGLDGGGTDDFTLASNGEATFVRPSGAASSVSLELVKRLDQSIRGIRPSQWTAIAPPGICSDCVVTLMHLTLRTADGSVQTHAVSWDPTNRAQVSAELVRVHDLALAAVRK